MTLPDPDPGRPHLRAAAGGAASRGSRSTRPSGPITARAIPGITLLELVAYLGESLLFRFNQIPDQTRLWLLRLLQVPPCPAAAGHRAGRVRAAAR